MAAPRGAGRRRRDAEAALAPEAAAAGSLHFAALGRRLLQLDEGGIEALSHQVTPGSIGSALARPSGS